MEAVQIKTEHQNYYSSKKSINKRRILAVSALVCFFFSIVPYLLYDIANEGSLCLLLIGMFFSLCTIAYPSSMSGKIQRTFWGVLRIFLWLFIVCEIAMSSFMVGSIILRPSVAKDKTVVILGCRTIDGKPSNMLEARLNSAYNYLQHSPNSNVVVTGYVSTGDDVTQAKVMRDWLLEKGISDERIFLEEKAIDTDTNIKNTLNVILNNGLSKDIAVATDAYHMPRALLYSKKYGLNDASVLPSISDPLLIPIYWIREQLGIVEAILF